MAKSSDSKNYTANLQKFVFSHSPSGQRILVLCFGLIGFVLPLIYGYTNGFPVPYVHDELSNLVAADTFASGRLTNPTPALYEHFESPHLLMTPSYASKYPPMQSLFLALGQVLFGHPIFGVWISCGLMTAALFWMLAGWTRPKWAFLGTVLMVLFIGINSYWAQSYWGGAVAATGGCLFFGAFRRFLRAPSILLTSLMIAGGVILMNSRPFEGLVTMLPALFVLTIWLLRDKAFGYSEKFRRLVLPGIVLSGIALSAMAFYNFRVTGSPLTLPYTVHQRQYFSAPLFIFQKPSQSELRGHPRLRKLYDELSICAPLTHLSDYDLPDEAYLYPVYGFIYIAVRMPFFLLSLPLTIFIYLLIFPAIRRDKWLQFAFGTIVFTFFCMSLATYWDNCHYAAPVTGFFYLLAIACFRYCRAVIRQGRRRKFVPLFLIALTVFSFYDTLLRTSDTFFPAKAYTGEIYQYNALTLDKPIRLTIPKRATFLKAEIENYVAALPDNYLAIVSYDDNYTVHDEIVFNKADIENAKIIWAHDLGAEKNKQLIDHYQNRKVLMIRVASPDMEITPL